MPLAVGSTLTPTYLDFRVLSVPSLTFMNTSSMVVTDTPKLEIPSSVLRAARREKHIGSYL